MRSQVRAGRSYQACFGRAAALTCDAVQASVSEGVERFHPLASYRTGIGFCTAGQGDADPCLPMFGRPLRSVKDTQDFNDLTANAVRHHVARSLDHHFARPRNPSWPPEARVVGQHGYRGNHLIDNQQGRSRIVERNVLCFRVQILQRLP